MEFISRKQWSQQVCTGNSKLVGGCSCTLGWLESGNFGRSKKKKRAYDVRAAKSPWKRWMIYELMQIVNVCIQFSHWCLNEASICRDLMFHSLLWIQRLLFFGWVSETSQFNQKNQPLMSVNLPLKSPLPTSQSFHHKSTISYVGMEVGLIWLFFNTVNKFICQQIIFCWWQMNTCLGNIWLVSDFF